MLVNRGVYNFAHDLLFRKYKVKIIIEVSVNNVF